MLVDTNLSFFASRAFALPFFFSFCVWRELRLIKIYERSFELRWPAGIYFLSFSFLIFSRRLFFSGLCWWRKFSSRFCSRSTKIFSLLDFLFFSAANDFFVFFYPLRLRNFIWQIELAVDPDKSNFVPSSSLTKWISHRSTFEVNWNPKLAANSVAKKLFSSLLAQKLHKKKVFSYVPLTHRFRLKRRTKKCTKNMITMSWNTKLSSSRTVHARFTLTSRIRWC